jgi:hypothetical protein
LAESESAEPWQKGLLACCLNEFASHSGERLLMRSVGGQVRGVLSDVFRRLDNRPLLDAFIGAANALGAVPYDGIATDTRAAVRCILPTIYEPVPGEAIVFGLSWSNSDYGDGGYGVSAFVLRLVCLNGMVGASQMKKIHLGRRLDDNLELSQRTYELDTQTMASATRDIVRGALGPKSIDTQIDLIRRAASDVTDLKAQWAAIGKSLTKGEFKRVQEAFDGPDVINLPPVKTAWRISNALSWVANNDETAAERKLRLQELAGQVIRN